ncbi:hypothetical protein I2494_11565 [Budviciaceae bacterium BWR-B9]|uniref:5-carboxymethyl-2-hydroxymuconate Delta-isomerase n=1 Tax=Limnobaculum allomyrinae TaxID=2791986 RepID=A0ABS1IRH2_9GAMM|nr:MULTISPECIES: hypothetical protein [Limnobaculum]MBK5144348.1 hypothetical protein [Limnobaculum allomyrinae]MBV7691907.1 hypothetical protein [Limnobaculum sp. M2-1]
MPQIHITYTPNLPSQSQLESFVIQIHQSVSPLISSDASNFKTYLTPIERSVIGLADKEKAVMHIDFRMFAGRSASIKQEVAKTILALAKSTFSQPNGVETEITLEVGNLDNDNYHKVIVNQ